MGNKNKNKTYPNANNPFVALGNNIEMAMRSGALDRRAVLTNLYYQYFRNIAISRIRYDGLPPEIRESYVEQLLFDCGRAVFFYDEVLEKYAVMPVILNGNIDNYGIPNRRYAYTQNYFKNLPKMNSVLLWDNYTDCPTSAYVMMYAESLADMRLTRDLNVFAQRSPVIVAGSKDLQLTWRNIMNEYNTFAKFINIDDEITNIEKLKVLDLKAPFVARDIQGLMKQDISSCLTLLGIDSNGEDKKERMVSDELSSNNGEIEANRNAFMDLRTRWCEQANRLFGLNIRPRFNTEIPIISNDNTEDGREGVVSEDE